MDSRRPRRPCRSERRGVCRKRAQRSQNGLQFPSTLSALRSNGERAGVRCFQLSAFDVRYSARKSRRWGSTGGNGGNRDSGFIQFSEANEVNEEDLRWSFSVISVSSCSRFHPVNPVHPVKTHPHAETRRRGARGRRDANCANDRQLNTEEADLALGPGLSDGDGDGVFVDIQADMECNAFYGVVVSSHSINESERLPRLVRGHSCGSAPRATRPALAGAFSRREEPHREHHDQAAQQNASPNGGPAPQLGNSNVTERPPSVS
jgi:hypothetical protein